MSNESVNGILPHHALFAMKRQVRSSGGVGVMLECKSQVDAALVFGLKRMMAPPIESIRKQRGQGSAVSLFV